MAFQGNSRSYKEKFIIVKFIVTPFCSHFKKYIYFCFVLKIGFLYITGLAVLELTLASNSLRFACLCLPNASIKGQPFFFLSEEMFQVMIIWLLKTCQQVINLTRDNQMYLDIMQQNKKYPELHLANNPINPPRQNLYRKHQKEGPCLPPPQESNQQTQECEKFNRTISSTNEWK